MNKQLIARMQSQFDALDQFRGVTKLITHGKGGQRDIPDFMLTHDAL